ncbi:MAG: S8 family serine peptidase [Synergistaceae bacterium]|nr:S8 family serine peptidase [Synergistaceae bacterium]
MRLKINILLLIFALLFNIDAAFAKNIAHRDGDVLVIFKGEEGERVTAASLKGVGRDALRAASIASENGAWVKGIYNNLSQAGNGVFALIHSDILSADELVSELLERPDVIAASPNYIVRAAAVPNDTATPSNNTGLWGLNAIGASQLWERDITGSSNIYVAVIDTGIDYTHQDLVANIDLNLSKNFVSSVSDFMDDNGHGTHISGIIGAVGNNNYGITGINWNVKIIALKALDHEGVGDIADIINALDYVYELLNNNKNLNLAAVNMSLEAYAGYAPNRISNKSEPLWLAMKYIDLLNRTNLIVAAGNSGVNIGEPAPSKGEDYDKGDYVYPASFTGLYNMLSVSASDSDGNVASFSNKKADVSAPGVNILSTWPAAKSSIKAQSLDDGSRVAAFQGTSMAAPHVAGAIALLKSYRPELTASQVKAVMKANLSGHDDALDVYDMVSYAEDAANQDAIAAAKDLPEEYQIDDLDNSDDNSSSGSNNKSRGSSGCRSFNINLLILLAVLFIVVNKNLNLKIK